MARLATDPKVPAQVRQREAARPGQGDKAFFFVHRCSLFPWHIRHRRVLPMSLVYLLPMSLGCTGENLDDFHPFVVCRFTTL